MKDICIVYSRENKGLTKKLVSKLESDGISCWVAPRDFKQDTKESLKQTVENSKVLMLIVDKTSVSSKEQMNAFEIAMENELGIIPFVIEKIESNLYTEYFFYAFSWVDCYDETFEDAYEVLLDAYEELSGEKKGEKKVRTPGKKSQSSGNTKPVIYGLIAIAIIIVGYFVYDSFSDSEQTETLVGQWHLADYYDNLKRSQQDSIDFMVRVIPSIKQNALLIFNEDHTFERRGFSPEPQIGKWRLNDEGNILYLEPQGATASTDQLRIDGLSPDGFTIIVDEDITDSVLLSNGQYQKRTAKVNTRLTFRR